MNVIDPALRLSTAATLEGNLLGSLSAQRHVREILTQIDSRLAGVDRTALVLGDIEPAALPLTLLRHAPEVVRGIARVQANGHAASAASDLANCMQDIQQWTRTGLNQGLEAKTDQEIGRIQDLLPARLRAFRAAGGSFAAERSGAMVAETLLAVDDRAYDALIARQPTESLRQALEGVRQLHHEGRELVLHVPKLQRAVDAAIPLLKRAVRHDLQHARRIVQPLGLTGKETVFPRVNIDSLTDMSTFQSSITLGTREGVSASASGDIPIHEYGHAIFEKLVGPVQWRCDHPLNESFGDIVALMSRGGPKTIYSLYADGTKRFVRYPTDPVRIDQIEGAPIEQHDAANVATQSFLRLADRVGKRHAFSIWVKGIRGLTDSAHDTRAMAAATYASVQQDPRTAEAVRRAWLPAGVDVAANA